MSYEEEDPPKEYALVTPPKDAASEQPLLAATQPSPAPSADGSFKPLSQEADEAPFTPTEYTDLEPLPFHEDAFIDGKFSPGNAQAVWKLVNYSPIEVEGSGVVSKGVQGAKSVGGITQSPIELNETSLTPKSVDSKHDERAENAKKPSPQFTRDGSKKESGEEKPPAHPHHPWHMYPPPPYYYHPYHYGYPPHHDQRRLPPPSLYPKPGHYAHPPPPAYGQYGRPPFGPGHYEEVVIKKVTDQDVICGRGGAVNNHAGNRKFRQYIQEHKVMYLNATKQKKPSVAMRVLDTVRKTGGRFLVKAPGGPGYLLCCEDRAREKASQALREAAAKLRKAGYKAKPSPAEKSAGVVIPKQGLKIKRVLLPNELPCAQSLEDGPDCPSAFEPPRDPPRKKIKQEAV